MIINQMNGTYRVKASNLQQLNQVARDIMDTFDSCELQYIKRALNGRADELARTAAETRKGRTKRRLDDDDGDDDDSEED